MRTIFLLLAILACVGSARGQARLFPDGVTSAGVSYSVAQQPEDQFRQALTVGVAPIGRMDLWTGVLGAGDGADAAMAGGFRALLLRERSGSPLSLETGFYATGSSGYTLMAVELGLSRSVDWAENLATTVTAGYAREHTSHGESHIVLSAASELPVAPQTLADNDIWTLQLANRIRISSQFFLIATPGLRVDPRGSTYSLAVGFSQIGLP